MKVIFCLFTLFSLSFCQASVQEYLNGNCAKPAIVKFNLAASATYRPVTDYLMTNLNQVNIYSIFCVNGVGLYFSTGLEFDPTKNTSCKFNSTGTCTSQSGNAVTILGMYQSNEISDVSSAGVRMAPNFFA